MRAIFISLFLLGIFYLSGHAQDQGNTITDSIRSIEYIRVKHTDAASWIKRYQHDINLLYEANQAIDSLSCDILFLGSSSINLWEGLPEDMSPMTMIRRSYGGAALRDMLYNYDIIARGFNPKCIVMYVENDICGAPEDLTLGETFDYFRIFINRLQRDYPDIPLFLLSIKPSVAREKMIPKQRIMNTLLEEYASITENVHYLDVASTLYDQNGLLRRDFFRSDSLHITREAYDLWRDILKPEIIQAIYPH